MLQSRASRRSTRSSGVLLTPLFGKARARCSRRTAGRAVPRCTDAAQGPCRALRSATWLYEGSAFLRNARRGSSARRATVARGFRPSAFSSSASRVDSGVRAGFERRKLQRSASRLEPVGRSPGDRWVERRGSGAAVAAALVPAVHANDGWLAPCAYPRAGAGWSGSSRHVAVQISILLQMMVTSSVVSSSKTSRPGACGTPRACSTRWPARGPASRSSRRPGPALCRRGRRRAGPAADRAHDVVAGDHPPPEREAVMAATSAARLLESLGHAIEDVRSRGAR